MCGVIFSALSLPCVTEDQLIYFVTHCQQSLKLRFTTIKLYLAGIRYFYIRAGHGDVMDKRLRLQYILRGIKKTQNNVTVERLPITFCILQKLCALLQAGVFSPFLDLLLQCAFQIAYFGFLRCGEFTTRNKQRDEHGCLMLSDICFAPDLSYYKLVLHESKCDPFRKGVVITIYENNVLCPVAKMNQFVKLRRLCSATAFSPLFVVDALSNNPLTRGDFITYLRQLLTRLGYDNSRYCGHSFRIGAATSAASAGVEDHLIQTLGRWSSNCFTRYIHTSTRSICKAQRLMCN